MWQPVKAEIQYDKFMDLHKVSVSLDDVHLFVNIAGTAPGVWDTPDSIAHVVTKQVLARLQEKVKEAVEQALGDQPSPSLIDTPSVFDKYKQAVLSEFSPDFKSILVGDTNHTPSPSFEEIWKKPASAASESTVISTLEKAIPGIRHMKVAGCPQQGCSCGNTSERLVRVIVHLNDYHRWTRERIADWLETLDHDLTMHAPGGEEVK